mgnify:CR=1 FL=1
MCDDLSERSGAALDDFGRAQVDQHISVDASPALDNVRPATNAPARREPRALKLRLKPTRIGRAIRRWDRWTREDGAMGASSMPLGLGSNASALCDRDRVSRDAGFWPPRQHASTDGTRALPVFSICVNLPYLRIRLELASFVRDLKKLNGYLTASEALCVSVLLFFQAER